MYALMAEYESSGLSQQTFCAKYGIKRSTFGYWRTKYLAKEKAPGVGFVSLVPGQGWGHEIRLRYGEVELSFDSGVSVDFLAGLVKKLSI
jgi:hypothetical protein